MIIDYAARARALVGTRFRPQGRSSDGLDCIGVAMKTFGIAAELVRADYSCRGDHLREIKTGLGPFFRRVATNSARSGDLLLLQVTPDQFHLAVQTTDGFVHAHSALRRVVETPGSPAWPVLGVYRKKRSR